MSEGRYGVDFIIDGKTGRRIPVMPGAPHDQIGMYLLMLVETIGYDAAFAFVFGRRPTREERS